jgi:hypothetical protein
MKKAFMKNLLLALTGIFLACRLSAQQDGGVYNTFKDRWVINTYSVETLPRKKLDVRITHRFGDLAGDAGGWKSFYGLENATDVSFGAEYGASEHLTVGIARSKGSGQLRQLMSGLIKYRVLHQKEGGSPVSLTPAATFSVSTSRKSSDPSSMTFFDKFSHRLVYAGQILAARKFSDRFSLQLAAGLHHRNVVPAGDENNLVFTGLAFRLQVTKTLGLIGDMTLPLNGKQSPFTNESGLTKYYMPIGLGLEFETGGHVFQLNFTNTTGIMPTDYIPYTRSNWLDGQYRVGFTISRIFNL